MTTETKRQRLQAHKPKPGMIIEPAITHEEIPIVTDLNAGLGKSLSANELKAELRKSFEETTGFKIA